jgi:CHAT domain-containing protein
VSARERKIASWVGSLAALLVIGWPGALLAARSGDFALGSNAEKQACRATERFDAPRGARAVDIYCGAWERPSGHLALAPAAQQEDALARFAESCQGDETALPSAEFSQLRQIACASHVQGAPPGPRRYGLIARRGGMVITGSAYPADWVPLLEAARVLSGAAPATAVASRDEATTPGLREIEAVYPGGPPGQGAEVNYEILRRRAFEHNVIWSFASSEQDFEAILRAHDTVSPEDVEGRADILAEVGLNLSNARRFTEAADALDRAESEAKSAKAMLLLSKIENYRAMDQLNQRRYAAALNLALEANRMRQAGGGGEQGSIVSATDARAVDRATPSAQRNLLIAFDEVTPQERKAVLDAQGFFIAGVAARARGDADAQAYLERATGELAQAQSPPVWLSSAIADEEAHVRLAKGDFVGAAARAQAGLTQVRLVAPQTRSEAHLLLTLARAQEGLGQTANALQSGREAMRIFAHQLEEPGLPADVASGQLGLLLSEWRRTNDPRLASEFFETMALVWDGAAARSASQLAARLALQGSGDKARAYQDAERAYRAALAARQRLAVDPGATPAQIAQAEAQIKDATQRYGATEGDLRAAAPGYLELLNPTASTSDLQGVLADKEGYLRIVIAADGGYGALVTRAGTHPFHIDLTTAQADDLVGKIRRSTAFRGRSLPSYDIADSASLYTALIGPIASDLAGLDQLDVDVSGALASAPLGALVTVAPQGEAARKVAEDEDYSGVDWLARHVAVTNALGPASLVRFRRSQAGRAPPAPLLAAFGDFRPDPVGAAARIAADHGLSDACQKEIAHALATLGPLPDTAEEARDVSAAFAGKSRLRLGADFTDVDFLGDPQVGQADVVLLATHGVLGLSSCFAEPALLTSLGPTGDALIEASRVLDRKLEARLVILSACDTAGGSLADGGEALSGLARGFLYAGAAAVLATEWKVDSATSAAEVRAFLTAADKPDQPLALALAAAQKTIYDSPETGHPFYWAAFILVGNGEAEIGAPAKTAVALR